MSGSGTGYNRKDVEEHWRVRLTEARATYEAAVSQFRIASEDFRSHNLPSPDGGFGVHLAIAAESAARKEYMRVLRVFTELVLHGRKPAV